MASTQITSSTPSHRNVFLSFRGIDTRLSFTSHLYDALHRNGIRTFMDDPELYSGELISSALIEAIRNSNIYIVVLSQNYAYSSWCLDEIFKCSKELGRSVLPVFYKIHPSVVRHQNGSFDTAFEKHEKVQFVGMDKLNKWRLTLSQVADFSGHHVGETRSEVDIINEIVDAVLREINPLTLTVAKYPVGIDSRVADIISLLTSDTKGVHYIGIWGMGGVGKTTLAKAVYNANFRSFEGSCFLENVPKVSGQSKGMQGLQAQLVANVLKIKKPEIDSVDQGMELIRQRICSKRVLIVVDDLNDQKQLDSLVVGSFACGSVIILTTRHQDVLARVGVEATYQYMLNELGDADSQQLFNKHAFGGDNPSDIFVPLSKEILHHAGGLPLALEIFGSNLRNQPEAEWKRFIGRLKDVPHPNILNKLKISFYGLVDDILKEMFVDIACFFVGGSRNYVVTILGSYYKDVDANIDCLKSRCLIKIDKNNRVSMHDLVRDMGWEIARQSSDKDELEKHSRISGWKDIYSVLVDNKGTATIKGMICHYEYDKTIRSLEHPYGYDKSCSETFDTETFKSMPKLRFLKMNNVNLTGRFEQTFKDLRWLHWSNCPLKSLDSDFCPKKLVILELPDSKITRWTLTQDLTNLKILDLSGSSQLITLPDFCRLSFLETIILVRCFSLKKVHTTIADLKNLVSLYLSGCDSLRSLPASVCKLTALEILDIGGCDSLEALPDELGNTISLTKLVVGGNHILKLPDSIGLLGNLVELRLSINKLETLVDTICNLRSLEILDFSECAGINEWLPYGISQLSNLQLPPNLIELRANYCRSMLRLPDLSNLKHLKILELRDCRRLREIEGLEELTSIIKLDLEGCSSMKRLPNLSNLKQLEKLLLRNCSSLREIEVLEELTSTIKLDLKGCRAIKTLPNLSNFKKLEILILTDCSSLTETENLEELTSVRYLHLGGCNSTMVAKTLTKSLFQRNLEFGNGIRIYIDTEDIPNWMSHSGRWWTQVQTNWSHIINFLGLLISLDCHADLGQEGIHTFSHHYTYTINNKTTYLTSSEAIMMVTVPREELIKLCGDYGEDTIFHIAASCTQHKEADVYIGVHPLYKLPQTSHASNPHVILQPTFNLFPPPHSNSLSSPISQVSSSLINSSLRFTNSMNHLVESLESFEPLSVINPSPHASHMMPRTEASNVPSPYAARSLACPYRPLLIGPRRASEAPSGSSFPKPTCPLNGGGPRGFHPIVPRLPNRAPFKPRMQSASHMMPRAETSNVPSPSAARSLARPYRPLLIGPRRASEAPSGSSFPKPSRPLNGGGPRAFYPIVSKFPNRVPFNPRMQSTSHVMPRVEASNFSSPSVARSLARPYHPFPIGPCRASEAPSRSSFPKPTCPLNGGGLRAFHPIVPRFSNKVPFNPRMQSVKKDEIIEERSAGRRQERGRERK